MHRMDLLKLWHVFGSKSAT